MNRKILATILIIIFLILLTGCSSSNETIPEKAEDEIKLEIQLNVKEDIGLLIVDYESGDTHCSGGTSNADKSLLKHDELISYTIDKNSFNNPQDVFDLSIQFSIITEYCDPNYENIYPEEYTVKMDPISFEASFGKTYYITINGDKVNGYTATLSK